MRLAHQVVGIVALALRGLPAGRPPATRNGDDLIEDAGDPGNPLDQFLSELPPFLPIDRTAQRHVAAVGGDEHPLGIDLRAHPESCLRSRHDAEVDELAL